MRAVYDRFGSQGVAAAEVLGDPASVNWLTLRLLVCGGAVPRADGEERWEWLTWIFAWIIGSGSITALRT